jgi:enterobactin synthetase component D
VAHGFRNTSETNTAHDWESDLIASTQFGLSQGFITNVRARDVGPGTLVQADFDISKYDDSLFECLGIAYPQKLDTAITKRRAEFVAGRYVAHLAQRTLGHNAQILIAPDRSPIWPEGICGSITHTTGCCASLVLPQGAGHPGIDIEMRAMPGNLDAILHRTIDASERALIAAADDVALAATLCFSGKETLYKALFPTVKTFFGFECARLTALPQSGQMTLQLTQVLHPSLQPPLKFALHYDVNEPFVMTWMVGEFET